jgi:broad specificity phosphatase PhoE
MNSPVVEAQDLRFSETWVEEVVKKIILPLWNTYSFFTTYANIDKWSPEKLNIYYCRHGQTDNNKNDIMNGGDDNTPLNEKWIQQAYETGKLFNLKNEKIDIIISSHLSRAYDTAKIIAWEIGYNWEIIIDDRLRDQDSWVLKWKGKEEMKKEFHLKNDTEFRRFFRDKKNNQVESVEEFEKRVLESYEEIQEKYKGKNILITAHTGTIRPIIKKLDNLSSDEAYYENESIPNATIIKLPTSGRKNILDKWILWELHSLIKEVEQGMDKYMIAEATRPIIKFMDNLTNWYIRRSRKRFWKSENDEDKLQAYETLYEVLITLCRVIAPFMPFISEHIYRNLTNKKSIHLDTFPRSVSVFINEDINSQFEKTARLVNLGLAWRQRNNLRVRQPLLSSTIWENLEAYYLDILKEELNVKEIIVLENSDKIAKKICKPNARIIGPKFWADVKFIMNEAKSGNFEELEDGKVKVGSFILEKDEYEIAFEAWDSSLDIEAWFGMVIALDKNLTPELIDEGIARDIVRQIQETRKEANFEVDDRIQLCLKGENLENIMKNFWEYIQNETLSTLAKTIENPDIEKQILIEEKEVMIQLKK